MSRLLLLCAGTFLLAPPVAGQQMDNGSLTGGYSFVHLSMATDGNSLVDTRVMSGGLDFDGQGAFSFEGALTIGAGAAGDVQGAGAYRVSAGGGIVMTNPVRPNADLVGGLNDGASAFLASSATAEGNTYEMLIALRAPSSGVENATLRGVYAGATLAFPRAAGGRVQSAAFTLNSDGQGNFVSGEVEGHSAARFGLRESQTIAGATYDLGEDGSGTASFGPGADLLAGDRQIFVTADGRFLLGTSEGPGSRDILFAVRLADSAVADADWQGPYRMVEATLGVSRFSAGFGGLRASGDGRAAIAQRLNLNGRRVDFSGVNFYSLGAGGGQLTPDSEARASSLALGEDASAAVGAQLHGAAYGMFVCLRAPQIAEPGSFLYPGGAVNGASFAPLPTPLAPGMIASLFGTELSAGSAQAPAIPLPREMAATSVYVNGTQSPLYLVSPTQVNFQVPYGVSGPEALVQVKSGETFTNVVSVPLRPTSPGLFTFAHGGSPVRGVIFHADFTVVTPTNPAHPGETVILYVTGLGELNPPVAAGDANPGNQLVYAIDRGVGVWIGRLSATVTFAGGAPWFVGLNQINIVVPERAPPGDLIPVAVGTSDAMTDIADIAVGNQ